MKLTALEPLCFSALQVLDPSFGMYVWPCAPVLSKFIWKNRTRFCGKKVLELGAGTALPSVVAAKCGAHVILSDAEEYEKILEIGKYNMLQNNVPIDNFKIIGLTWGVFNPSLIFMEPIDFILGSDVFYSATDFQDVIVTVSYILRKNPLAEFWCTYEKRCPDWNIAHLLLRWNLACKEVPIDDLEYQDIGDKTINLFIFSYKENDNY